MALWGGRFKGETDKRMWQFNASIDFDQRLYAADIRGSMAYAEALETMGLISSSERSDLVAGLAAILEEFESGTFDLKPDDEDIHTAVERRLAELVGTVAGKLHTGRSRNDQVSTDLRLYLAEQISHLQQALLSVQEAILAKSELCLGIIMPGYTHLQQAQPVLFSHWLMSFFWKLERDHQRLLQLSERVSSLPLGSGALAGHPFAVDRQELATRLGFSSVMPNSIDGVNDRDYVVEFLAWASLLQVHLSSLSEDLIIWSSHEFGFVQLDDAYSTGSSIMPQKKNPDPLELVRGKSGRVFGHLLGLLTTLKGLPSAYNKDLQEDKEALFDTLDTLKMELPIVAGLIRTLQVNQDRMNQALSDGLLATDLAEYLVRKGVPFRTSHELVGQAVKRAETLGTSLGKLPIHEYKSIHAAFDTDVTEVFDFERSIETRNAVGGTGTHSVRQQTALARSQLTNRESRAEQECS